MSRGRTVGRHARIAVRSRLIKRLPQLRCYRRTNVQPSLDSRPQGNIASRWLPPPSQNIPYAQPQPSERFSLLANRTAATCARRSGISATLRHPPPISGLVPVGKGGRLGPDGRRRRQLRKVSTGSLRSRRTHTSRQKRTFTPSVMMHKYTSRTATYWAKPGLLSSRPAS
jgi:hypothetical protein